MKLKFANLKITSKDINEETKSISAVFSTADVDRHGEVVDQKSWILDDFKDNPVVLFGHDHSQPPIGKINNLGYNKDGNLSGEVQFAADEYPFANVIWQLYKGGFMRAFSVGFSAGLVDIIDNQVILKENTLYEVSTVAVPANAMALAKSKGINVDALNDKYLEQSKKKNNEEEEEEEIEIEEETPAPVEETTPEPEPAAETTPEPEITPEVPAEEKKEEQKGIVVGDPCFCVDGREGKYGPGDQVGLVCIPNEELEADKSLATIESEIAKIKAKTVLTDKQKKSLEGTQKACEEILAVGKPAEEIKKLSTDITDNFIKVETPAVRVVVAKKSQNKTKLINKAIRALLVEKAKH